MNQEETQTRVGLPGFAFLTCKKGLTMPVTLGISQGKWENLQSTCASHLLVFSQWELSPTFRFSGAECVFHLWAPGVFSVCKGKHKAGIQLPCPSSSYTIYSFIHLLRECVLEALCAWHRQLTAESRSEKDTTLRRRSCDRRRGATESGEALPRAVHRASWGRDVWFGFWRMHVNYHRRQGGGGRKWCLKQRNSRFLNQKRLLTFLLKG